MINYRFIYNVIIYITVIYYLKVVWTKITDHFDQVQQKETQKNKFLYRFPINGSFLFNPYF